MHFNKNPYLFYFCANLVIIFHALASFSGGHSYFVTDRLHRGGTSVLVSSVKHDKNDKERSKFSLKHRMKASLTAG